MEVDDQDLQWLLNLLEREDAGHGYGWVMLPGDLSSLSSQFYLGNSKVTDLQFSSHQRQATLNFSFPFGDIPYVILSSTTSHHKIFVPSYFHHMLTNEESNGGNIGLLGMESNMDVG